MEERHLFYDELGNEVQFIVKAKFSLDETDYVALLQADDIESPIFLLRIEIDDNGDEILVGIDDEELKEAEETYEELLKEKIVVLEELVKTAEKEVNKILSSNDIQPIQSNVDRFYAWMQNLENKYLADQVRMARAFHIVATHQIKTLKN